MAEQKVILQTYRDIVSGIKTNTITDLNTAFSDGTLSFPEEERERFFVLLGTLIDQYSANGYEALMRITKPTKTKTKRK